MQPSIGFCWHDNAHAVRSNSYPSVFLLIAIKTAWEFSQYTHDVHRLATWFTNADNFYRPFLTVALSNGKVKYDMIHLTVLFSRRYSSG